jgi:NAD(P)-dependent dehydrogenase (short-subunit alcohol dehydrogenase family)
MGVIAITGSAGGIGQATQARLEKDGHRVIGVDVRDAEVIADLSMPDGRAAMVAAVTEQAGGALDGLVAGAGIMDGEPGLVVAINYFGAVATFEGLRPLLAQNGGAAVAISSNSATAQPSVSLDLVDACLTGDEAAAVGVAAGYTGLTAYPASKLALARWVRRQAPAWVKEGVRLNAIAPGLIRTPMTAESEEFILGLGDIYPIPIGRPGEASEVAGLLALLLGDEGRFFAGSVIFVDGGTDAALRPDDWPAPLP